MVTNAGPYANKLLMNFDSSSLACTPTPAYNFNNLTNGFSVEFDLDIVTNIDTHFMSVGIFKDYPDGGYSHPYGIDLLIGKYLGLNVYALSIRGVIQDVISAPELFSPSNTKVKIKICATASGFPISNGSRIALFLNDRPYPLSCNRE